MKNILLVFLSFFSANAQQISPLPDVPITANSFIGYDNHGDAYFVVNNTFIKTKENRALEYKNLDFGRISRADILNPLKIVLLYSDFNTVVMLDNQLNETSQINFSKTKDQIIVGATGNASRNKLWIYNELTNEIGLYDYLRKEYQVLTQPLNGTIIYYETDFNSFSWINNKFERFSCDIYGKITSYDVVPEFDEIQFIDKSSFIIRIGTNIKYVNSNGDVKTLVDVDQKTFKSFYYSPQKLAIFTTSGIKNFKITIP